MSFDGLIWKPIKKEGFLVDPVSMAEILWSIHQDWYVVTIYDPEDQEKYIAAMEYFVDIGFFDKPVNTNIDVIFKLIVNDKCIVSSVLTKPNDLQSLIFMIAYSDFDGLQIRSIDKNKEYYWNVLDLWCDSEKIMYSCNADWLERLPYIKNESEINIIWGTLPSEICGQTALVISDNETILYNMKNVIEHHQQNYEQDSYVKYSHHATLCDVKEELLKYEES